MLYRIPTQCADHYRNMTRTELITEHKSSHLTLNHLNPLIDITLLVGFPYTASILQFRANKSKVS